MSIVNWDDDIPNIWKNKIHVPNHQTSLEISQGILKVRELGRNPWSLSDLSVVTGPSEAKLKTAGFFALFPQFSQKNLHATRTTDI